MRNPVPTRILPLLLALTLAGCVSLPFQRQAELPLPERWPQAQTAGDTQAVAPDWWKAYGDPALDAAMEEALDHNGDIRLAAARVAAARAIVAATRSQQSPYAEVGAGAGRNRATEKGSFPIPSPINNNFQVGLRAAYELDLWDRYAQATEAARAELLATEYGREAVRLGLTRDVAVGWFAYTALGDRAALARTTLDNREQALALQRLRASAGVSSDYELRQAEAEVAATRSELARLGQSRAQAEHALGLLLGRSPQALVEGRVAAGKALAEVAPPEIPAGLPSQVLQRRPDLKQAEAGLAAAQARIAEARAAIYPNLSLTANLGSESRRLADLFSGPATAWGLTAGLAQTVFNAGRTEAVMRERAAQREQLLIQYEQAVRQAFRETLDALVALRQAREIADAETQRAASLAGALELAELRHQNGVASYLEVLDAQRNLHAARQASLEARRARLAAAADLATALGGGWSADSMKAEDGPGPR